MKRFMILTAICGLAMAAPPAPSGFNAVNVAYRKSVWQSSVEDWAHCPPPKAVDADYRSDFTDESCSCAMTKKEINPWLRINLGEAYEIHYVTVAVRWRNPNGPQFKDSNLEIRIGNNPDITQNTVCKYLDGPAKQASGFVYCEGGPITGQYVSVQRKRAGYKDNMHICEMRAFTMVPIPVVAPPPRDNCFLEKDVGTGSGSETRYYFLEDKCECREFVYKGSGGNGNNYENMEACQSVCTEWEPPARCFEPIATGTAESGEEYTLKYSYNPGTNLCKKFKYKGSGGNGNNFDSKEQCRTTCKRC